MNPFLLPSSERLSEWRNFRKSLEQMEETEQLKELARWVSQAPTSNYVLDFDDAKSWPTPWDLLHEGDFDDTSKAYLMEQTLLMLGWDPSRLTLHMIRNIEASTQTMILLVDNELALNYSHSEIINFDKHRSNCAYLVSYSVNPEGGHTEI